MGDPINQQVIEFTADYTGYTPASINDLTTLDSIGIISEEDRTQYVMELEQFFGLTYEEGDEIGIVIVGNAVVLIKKKLGTVVSSD